MLIKVVPSSISGYSSKANANFESIQTSLRQIINDCVGVVYDGENAVQFKNDVGLIATTFAKEINGDLGGMVTAVNASLSRIAGSLGGNPPVVGFTAASTVVAAQVSQKADLYDVNTEGLEALQGQLSTQFNAVRAQLTEHKSALNATDWQGNAKTSAVTSVTGLTTKASGKCDAYLADLNGRIVQQLQTARAADAVAVGI